MNKEKILKICGLFIEYGILSIVFFVPMIFDYSFTSYNCFDLYKVIFFRVVLFLILIAFIVKIFIKEEFIYRGSFKIFLLIGFLLTSFFISSFFSLDPNQSFWGNFLRQQGFYNFFCYLLFFVLLILNIENYKQIKNLILAVVFSSFFISSYGLIQYVGLDPFVWSESAFKSGRIFSNLGQPNFLGHWLIIVLPLTFYSLIFIAKKNLAKFFIGLVLLMQLICLIFTYSRAAWLGFLGAIIFLIIFWLFYKGFKKIFFTFIGFLLVSFIFIIAWNVVVKNKQFSPDGAGIINRLQSIVEFNSGSNKMRLYYLKSAVEEIKKENYQRLIIGYGPEVLADVFINYYKIDWGVYESINSFPDRAHNWLFDKILALGFLGLAVTLVFYIYLIYKGIIFLLAKKHLQPEDWLVVFLFSSLVAYFINNLFSFSLFTVLIYLHFILAVYWIIISRETEIKIFRIKLTFFSKIVIFCSLILAAGVFIYTKNINQVRAEIYYIKALNSVKSSNCAGLINNMEKVMGIDPKNYYYRENYLFLMFNCFSSINNKSIQKQLSDNMLYNINLFSDRKTYGILHNTARIYSLLGSHLNKDYYFEAERIYNYLIKMFPYFTGVYEDLAKQKIAQEDYIGAVEVLNKELKILPSINDSYLNEQHRQQIIYIIVRLYENLGQAYFKMKNYDLAFEAYDQGLKLDPYRATLYKNIADIYYLRNQLDEAIKLNQRGFMLNPSDYHWPLALSLLYRDKKDLQTAKEYLNKALELAPDNKELKKYQEELNK